MRTQSVGIQSGVEKITPEKARIWLQHQGKNRRISQAHVKKLASVMSAGKWSLNGQAICFDVNGKLIDGQHRLSAVIMSGVSVLSVVTRGIEDARAFETYDTTIRRRSAGAILDMDGIKNANTIAAIASRLTAWDKTQNKTTFSLASTHKYNLTQHDTVSTARSYMDEIRYMYEEMDGSRPFRRCGAPSALVAALILCNRVDDVATLLFTEGLKTGANLNVDSPVYLLREKLLDPPDRRRGTRWSTEVMALTIKAWNKFRNGETLKILRWRQEGDCPEKFPVPGGAR